MFLQWICIEVPILVARSTKKKPRDSSRVHYATHPSFYMFWEHFTTVVVCVEPLICWAPWEGAVRAHKKWKKIPPRANHVVHLGCLITHTIRFFFNLVENFAVKKAVNNVFCAERIKFWSLVGNRLCETCIATALTHTRQWVVCRWDWGGAVETWGNEC